ncbi:MAG: hypothetical protein ACJASN_003276 [Cyclobacteriaceae bacterium]|jgi:hypothetical protein
MNTVTIENQILSQLKDLDQEEKAHVLNYLKHRGPKRHSQKIHRKRALKQIRLALSVEA